MSVRLAVSVRWNSSVVTFPSVLLPVEIRWPSVQSVGVPSTVVTSPLVVSGLPGVVLISPDRLAVCRESSRRMLPSLFTLNCRELTTFPSLSMTVPFACTVPMLLPSSFTSSQPARSCSSPARAAAVGASRVWGSTVLLSLGFSSETVTVTSGCSPTAVAAPVPVLPLAVGVELTSLLLVSVLASPTFSASDSSPGISSTVKSVRVSVSVVFWVWVSVVVVV